MYLILLLPHRTIFSILRRVGLFRTLPSGCGSATGQYAATNFVPHLHLRYPTPPSTLLSSFADYRAVLSSNFDPPTISEKLQANVLGITERSKLRCLKINGSKCTILLLPSETKLIIYSSIVLPSQKLTVYPT